MSVAILSLNSEIRSYCGCSCCCGCCCVRFFVLGPPCTLLVKYSCAAMHLHLPSFAVPWALPCPTRQKALAVEKYRSTNPTANAIVYTYMANCCLRRGMWEVAYDGERSFSFYHILKCFGNIIHASKYGTSSQRHTQSAAGVSCMYHTSHVSV